jgi:hypothetical protein
LRADVVGIRLMLLRVVFIRVFQTPQQLQQRPSQTASIIVTYV